MKVVFTGEVFRAVCTYDERAIPQKAGFRWDNVKKYWYTPESVIALRLNPYLDASAKTEIAKTRIQIETWTKNLTIAPGERLENFQENAALFALSRNRSYLGLDPGLGKTPIAATIVASLFESEGPYSTIYICPPFLARNTEAEFKRFAPKVPVSRYGEGHHKWVTIIPDSIITRDEVQTEILKLLKRTPASKGSLLIVDEAHRFKNLTAKRTQALFGARARGGLAGLFDKIVYLSGTPMPNRPIELFPVLSHSAPQCIHYMNHHEYGERYCAAFQNQFAWDYSGASNLNQLVAQVIGTFMIRYRKSEVLKNLPPKTEEMVILSQDLSPKLTKLSSEILKNLDPEDLMMSQISINLGKDELHLSTYRRELGTLKAEAAAEFIRWVLEETEESVLVFAIHKDVIAELQRALRDYEPIVITGDTDMALRHERVKEFQERPDRRVFIGNIQAAGTGLTLTKATRVIFAEFSWTPADNDQASDRAHRIGQKGNVFVQYLVHENSVDKAVISTVLRKKRITEQL